MLKMELVKVCVVSDPGQEPYSACSFPLLLWDLMAVSAAPFMIGKKLYNHEQSCIFLDAPGSRAQFLSPELQPGCVWCVLWACHHVRCLQPPRIRWWSVLYWMPLCALRWQSQITVLFPSLHPVKKPPSEVWNHPLHHWSWLSLKSVFFWPTRSGKQRSVTF